MASNSIQLFALQVPTQISLPFDLYSLAVPRHWKELFNNLQQRKHGKSFVLPPVECLNNALHLLIDDDILFPSKKAFHLEANAKWLYTKSDQISTEYLVSIVKTWLRLSLKEADFLTEEDIININSLSAQDLQFQKVELPNQVWHIENSKLKIDPLYYNLIPYLLAKTIANEALQLVDPNTKKVFKEVIFRKCAINESDQAEIISWTPELEIKEVLDKKTNKKKKSQHYYSYRISFALHYTGDGKPYISCDYGIRRWVSWELKYLKTGVTTYISPQNSTRFAPCRLKYMGKQKGINFEGNLVLLLNELNFRSRFTAEDVIKTPCQREDLAWGVVYSNTMSYSHNAGAGLYPPDIAIFHQACREKIQTAFGSIFPSVEIYARCEDKKATEKTRSEHKKLKEFIKSHFTTFTTETASPPFHIPPNLQLILLEQDGKAKELISPLAKKYGLDDFVIQQLGDCGSQLIGDNWQSAVKNRIQKISENLKILQASFLGKKVITLIEILSKDIFEDTSQDPKCCFRPALAMLGSVTDHFVTKDENDKDDFLTEKELNEQISKNAAKKVENKQQGKVNKLSLKSEFAYRMEMSLLSLLSMAGAYFYPSFQQENFPADVASIGVYLIPYYIGEITKYLPVAVQMDKTGIKAKTYDCDDWLDFHTFQVKMASGLKEIHPIDLDLSKIQAWVFNNLFQECQKPTLFCFDTTNLRNRGLFFLQKQFWQQHSLAFSLGKDQPISFIPTSNYPHIRVASIIAPNNESEVPIYRVCDEDGELKGHTAGVFYPSYLNSECGNYYLSNQRPETRSGGILNESKLVYLPKTRGNNKGELKKPNPKGQGYNPRGIFINLTLQQGDCFSDWANYLQCLRLYALVHYLDAITFPAPLHLAAGLDDYRPIQAIREP